MQAGKPKQQAKASFGFAMASSSRIGAVGIALDVNLKNYWETQL